MALGDVDIRPIQAEAVASGRRCENCNAVMKQLAELPALSIRAAARVFRCYGCDHVASDRA